MGGTLKFPSRKKYVPEDKPVPKLEEKPISEEEHQRRIQKLKELGLLK